MSNPNNQNVVTRRSSPLGQQNVVTRRSPLGNVNSVRETPRKSNVHKPKKPVRDNPRPKQLLFKTDVGRSHSSLSVSLDDGSTSKDDQNISKQYHLLSQNSFESQEKPDVKSECTKNRLTPKSYPIDESPNITYDRVCSRQSGLSEIVLNTDQVMLENAKKNNWSSKFKERVQKILPGRKYDEDIDKSIDQGTSSDDSDDEYEAPTNFHAMCFTSTSLLEICEEYKKTSKEEREQLDYLGRSAPDLLFQNYPLAKSIQSNDNNFDEDKIRKVAIFVINLLQENNFHLTWHVFTEWIDTIDFGRSNRDPDTSWLGVIAAFHKQSKYQRRTSNDIENQSKSIEKEQINSTEIEEYYGVTLPLQVYFALRILSVVITELDNARSIHKLKSNLTHSRMSLDSLSTEESPKRRSFGLKRNKYKENRASIESEARAICERYEAIENRQDFIDILVDSFASTKHLMKSFIMIDDENECKKIFEEDIVRRAMLKSQSIEGTWLSDMLQHDHRKRATAYLLLLSELSSNEARHADKESNGKRKQQLNDLLTRIGQLEGLIPSMLAVEERDIEDLATTPMITKVLDEMITSPFACTVFFFDFLLLGMLIFCFRLCVDAYLQQLETDIVLRWLYATLFSAFHFQMRAIGRVVSLISMTRNMIFRNAILFNFWNILQTGCLFMVISCIITIRFSAPNGQDEYLLSNTVRWQFAVTTLMLWFNLLGLVKSINMKLATFVCAISQIIKDVYWYVALIVGMILCFSQIFYTVLIPTNCVDVMGAKDCKPKEFYLLVYSVLLGELDDQIVGGIGDKVFALMMFFVFTFIMAIVMLNILIAVISDSYEKTMINSTKLFGRARVQQLAEILALQDLFRVRDDNKVSPHFFEWKYFKWTKGGFVFFVITTFMYLFWVIVDITALGVKERQHSNLSYVAFLLTLIMFGIFVLLLASSAQNVDSKIDVNNWLMNSVYKQIQWITVRLLGKSKSNDSLIYNEWAGRLMFIKTEIAASSKKMDDKLKVVRQELRRNRREASDLKNNMDAKLVHIQSQIAYLIEISKEEQTIAMGRSTI